MANRKRLTKDGFSRRAYDVENADPNSLNRRREVPDAEKYMTWDPEANVNYEKPDMQADWKEDASMRHPTLNIAMPGSKQANLALLRTAQTLAKKSSLAIKVANALFPDGTEDFIEKQATDLMDLPLRSLIDTVARINKYAAEEEEMVEEAMDDSEGADDAVEGDAAEEGDALGMDVAPAAPQSGGESWQQGGQPGENPPQQDPSAAVDLSAAGDIGSMSDVQPISLDGQDDFDMGTDAGEATDPFGAAASGEEEEMPEEDVNDGEQEMKLEAAIKASLTKTASKNDTAAKRGVKKIASAPRANVSSLDVENLSRLWKSDPDVSDHFSY